MAVTVTVTSPEASETDYGTYVSGSNINVAFTYTVAGSDPYGGFSYVRLKINGEIAWSSPTGGNDGSHSTGSVGLTPKTEFSGQVVVHWTDGETDYDAESQLVSFTTRGIPAYCKKACLGSDGSFILVPSIGGTSRGGVFISSDFGSSWSRKLPDSNDGTNWDKGICSSDGAYCFVESTGDALYRSANSGTSWALITPAGEDDFDVNDFAVSDDGKYVVIVGDNNTDTTKSCYISSDYGVTWTVKQPAEGSIEYVACDISDDGTVIAVSTNEYFYISFDSGETWVAQSVDGAPQENWDRLRISRDGTFGLAATCHVINGDDIYLGTRIVNYSEATWAESDLTSAGRALLDDADAAAQATTLGLGTGNYPQFAGIELGHASDTTITRVSAGVIAVEGTNVMLVGDAPTAHTIASHSDTSATGANLNTLVGGGDVGALHTHAAAYQPLDAGLTSLAGLTYASDSFIKVTATDTYAIRTIAETKTDLSLNNVSNVATDDTAYNATSWNANSDAATKNAIRDKVETMDTAIGLNTTHRGLTSGNPHSVTPTELSLVIGTNTQAWDAGLDSLAALSYVSDSMIKITAEDTYAVRTLAEVKTDLSLNLVENTAHSTDAHTMTIDGRDVSVDGTKLDGIEALADVTATNETSHADVVVDGDFVSNGILNRTGAGAYSILALGTDVQAYDAGLANLAGVAMIADKFYYTTADNVHAAATVTSFARSILDDANEATFKATVNLEIGTDVLAQQTIGIANDNLVEIDAADVADDDYARFTANGLEGRSAAEVLSDIGAAASGHNHDGTYQPLDAELTSLAGLSYVSASFVKMTGANTFALRTLQQTSDDLEATIDHDNLLNFVADEHIAHSGVTLTAGSGIAGGGTIAASRSFDLDINSLDAAAIAAGDFVPFWDITATATNKKITFANFEAALNHDSLAGFAAGEHFLQSAITEVGTIATGTWEATDVGIAHGGTGQSTAQLAVNALTAVAGATNEHVLTKDTATGNAIWKAAGAGTDVKVAIDVGATAGYLGAADSDGVLRTGTGLSYTDGGDFVTLAVAGCYVDRGNAVSDFNEGDTPTEGAWTDLDLGSGGLAIVPTGAVAILVHLRIKATASGKLLAVRKNGTTTAIGLSPSVNTQINGVVNYNTVVVGCDSNQVIEYYLIAGTDEFDLVVLGWWF